MMEDGGGKECSLQGIERQLAGRRPIPFGGGSGEPSERDRDVGIRGDETTIEVAEAEVRLNVLDLPRDRPILDGLDLIGGHTKPVGRKNVAQILDGGRVKLTLIRTSI